MNREDIEYLKKLDDELRKNNRRLTDVEIEKVSESLRTNVGVQDEPTALDIVGDIIFQQSKINDVEKLQGLVNEVIYHGELLGAEYAVRDARSVEIQIAAKFIDEERYDEFKDMVDKGYNPHAEFDGFVLMDRVKTLKGAEFMETNGFIPSGYFTQGFTHQRDASLLYAYPEQIDFYIERGADVNAEDGFGQNVLNHMLYSSRPTEAIEKVVNAGGYIEDCENAWDNLMLRVTTDFDRQLEFYGRQSIGRTLENINFLVKHGYKLESRDLAEIMANLLEKTPEFLETFKPSIEKEDLLQLKKNVMEIKIEKHNDDLVYVYDNNVAESEFSSLGKTGDSYTGIKTETHNETGKIQTNTAWAFMKRLMQKE